MNKLVIFCILILGFNIYSEKEKYLSENSPTKLRTKPSNDSKVLNVIPPLTSIEVAMTKVRRLSKGKEKHWYYFPDGKGYINGIRSFKIKTPADAKSLELTRQNSTCLSISSERLLLSENKAAYYADFANEGEESVRVKQEGFYQITDGGIVVTLVSGSEEILLCNEGHDAEGKPCVKPLKPKKIDIKYYESLRGFLNSEDELPTAMYRKSYSKNCTITTVDKVNLCYGKPDTIVTGYWCIKE
ncbi:hypothetical protein LEP1GSC058_1923 [Leptospira fainei serovar Hurstbridge str. BUT 6]|uniref:Uncharacterized protein n=1 Tax=Leptospira fainei serovar Hurstbridge str. BUT 6 TaxID=1193011 RepID=S3W5W7_9LEPT|nr:hypothetical protein [Leptospira fainei]EPG75552.1 hypothetical protein LEP1GSC058_1923 [Leptospira fainei serovar Hurstbridge str. BUT 6]